MKVSTKLNKDSESVKTIVTLNFDETTREELIDLAAKSAIIMAQAEWRTSGTIPATADINVHDLVNRERKARVNVFDQLKSMSIEDRKVWLAARGIEL